MFCRSHKRSYTSSSSVTKGVGTMRQVHKKGQKTHRRLLLQTHERMRVELLHAFLEDIIVALKKGHLKDCHVPAQDTRCFGACARFCLGWLVCVSCSRINFLWCFFPCLCWFHQQARIWCFAIMTHQTPIDQHRRQLDHPFQCLPICRHGGAQALVQSFFNAHT